MPAPRPSPAPRDNRADTGPRGTHAGVRHLEHGRALVRHDAPLASHGRKARRRIATRQTTCPRAPGAHRRGPSPGMRGSVEHGTSGGGHFRLPCVRADRARGTRRARATNTSSIGARCGHRADAHEDPPIASRAGAARISLTGRTIGASRTPTPRTLVPSSVPLVCRRATSLRPHAAGQRHGRSARHWHTWRTVCFDRGSGSPDSLWAVAAETVRSLASTRSQRSCGTRTGGPPHRRDRRLRA